jgi:hypothetical protein
MGRMQRLNNFKVASKQELKLVISGEIRCDDFETRDKVCLEILEMMEQIPRNRGGRMLRKHEKER